MKSPDGQNDWIAAFRRHIERRAPGAFIFSFSIESDGWHAGIYLGEIRGEHIAFAQHEHGGTFGPEVIYRCYADPDYYTPSTLIAANAA